MYKLQLPNGFMLMIYGTSVGSHSAVDEGKMQLSGRGYQTPPIVDAVGLYGRDHPTWPAGLVRPRRRERVLLRLVQGAQQGG